MKTCMRFVSLLVLSFLLAAPVMAACRKETSLPPDKVVKVTVTRTGSKTAVIQFAVLSPHGFVCNGNGGTLPLPPGCTTDGVSFKPTFSVNIASAPQSPQLCTLFNVTTTTQGQALAVFRVRYEENKITPARITIGVPLDLSKAFTGTTILTSTPFVISDPIE